jgi:transposase
MSLQHQDPPDVPEETKRIAQAAFPRGNIYMRLRDELGLLYADADFAALFPAIGQPAEAPWRLALVVVMQFLENLTDRQAADAVRARIDWKYTLSLELTDPGFDFSVLSEFRARLVTGAAEQVLLDRLLERCQERGWLKARGRQRTDSTHVLAAIHRLNRLELVGQMLQHTLNQLAVLAPDWLKAQAPAEWWSRYGRKLDDSRFPRTEAERRQWADQIGQDGAHLLALVAQANTPAAVGACEAVADLLQVWRQQYHYPPEAGKPLRWRENGELPPASERLVSPHDPQARYSVKRDWNWVGYKVHLTESCDPETPNLITHVETTPATEQDIDRVAPIHAALSEKGWLPAEHLVDTGYLSGEQLVKSLTEYGVKLVGPVRADVSWQAHQPDGYDARFFAIDWEAKRVTCPQGKVNSYWRDQTGVRGNPVIEVQFRKADCSGCAARARCTRSQNAPRTLTLLPREHFEAIQAARAWQETADFQQLYAHRAGIEGTVSQAVDSLAMRRTRYTGLAKTRLQHIATAVAINFGRLWAWLNGVPRAQTRVSAFAALAL